jgi:hypothetical protein
MWRVWDWPNWIQPQLDDIARVGNAVRFWGDILVLARNNITLDQYLHQWKQVMDYTQSIGLLVYPCGGSLNYWGNYSRANSIECYSELAGLLASYSNVIGMDIANEAWAFPWYQQNQPYPDSYHQPEPYDEFLQELGTAVRGHGIPITYSRNLWEATQWTQECTLDASTDFLDFHVYYTPDPHDSLPVYETSWGKGKKMLVGEFGLGTDKPSAARSDYYAAVRNLTVSDPNCVGAFAWSAYDINTTPEWEFGLFDRRRSLRDDIAKPFSQFPVQMT